MNHFAKFILFVLAGSGIASLLAMVPFLLKLRRNDPTAWERAIRRFEKADQRSAPPQKAILFAGSSSIRIWKSLQTDMAPLTVINRGFGGAQIHDVTEYVRRIITPYKPRAVVFYAGENDIAGILYSPEKTAEEVRIAYRKFCQAVHAGLPDVPIYFISIKPPKARRKYWPEMQIANQLVREDCASDPRLHFIDIVPAMLDQDANPRLDVFKLDGHHLNARGYVIWTSVIKPILVQAFPDRIR